MSPILELQKRFMQLGNVRLGDKGPKGEPRRRETLRFTTASRPLADAVAELYGGTVEPWTDAPDGDGYWQVGTETKQIDIVLPPVFSDADGSPTTTYSQFYESWTAAGCVHRCDGETDALSGQLCSCKPLVEVEGEEARICALTTRVSFMIPDLPGLGVWLLTTRGYNAAVELPGTLELLVRAAAEHAFIPAVLRLENRVKKQPGQPTKRFVVPVIDLPSVTLKQLASGDVPLVLNAPRQSPPKPAIPETIAPPVAPDLGVVRDTDAIPFGEPPEIQPESLRSSLLEEELLVACGQLDVDLDDVRAAIEQNRGDDQWLKRQVERARENLALRQAEELV
jgi:hypothetical protein